MFGSSVLAFFVDLAYHPHDSAMCMVALVLEFCKCILMSFLNFNFVVHVLLIVPHSCPCLVLNSLRTRRDVTVSLHTDCCTGRRSRLMVEVV